MRVESGAALRHLVRHGYLATMRDYPYKPGRYVRVYHRGRYVCTAIVGDVMPVTRQNLGYAVGASGFSSVEQWLEEARRLNRGRVPRYIVFITMVPKSLSPEFSNMGGDGG